MTNKPVSSSDPIATLSPDQKLDHIDSLRGIAILMVMFVHTSQSIPELPLWIKRAAKYGQFGVQLFFVVSAITLCISASRRNDEGNANIKYFIRRFFRIAPLYYFGIIWYFLFLSAKSTLETGMLQNADGYNLKNMLANFFFVHGFYPPANNNIVPGGWSIGTEMAFYVCFPLLFLLFKKINERGVLQMLVVIVIMIYGYYVFEDHYLKWAGNIITINDFIYYNLINQIPVFMLGILAYFLTINRVFEKIPTIVNVLFLGAFAALTVTLWHGYLYPVHPINLSPSRFMFIPFTAGLAFVFLYDIFAKHKFLNLPILRRIGQVSYSMYLLHFMFAWYAADYLNRWLGSTGRPIYLFALYYILTITFSLTVGVISERFIEKPGIRLGKRIIERMNNTTT